MEIKRRIYFLHTLILGANFLFQLLYELALLTWVVIDKTDSKPSHNTLIFLATCELGVSTTSVFTGILLCYMMDRMTDKPEENLKDQKYKNEMFPTTFYVGWKVNANLKRK